MGFELTLKEHAVMLAIFNALIDSFYVLIQNILQ
jgi:hypothetical protein